MERKKQFKLSATYTCLLFPEVQLSDYRDYMGLDS